MRRNPDIKKIGSVILTLLGEQLFISKLNFCEKKEFLLQAATISIEYKAFKCHLLELQI
jgi:hypothetical protein